MSTLMEDTISQSDYSQDLINTGHTQSDCSNDSLMDRRNQMADCFQDLINTDHTQSDCSNDKVSSAHTQSCGRLLPRPDQHWSHTIRLFQLQGQHQSHHSKDQANTGNTQSVRLFQSPSQHWSHTLRPFQRPGQHWSQTISQSGCSKEHFNTG